MKNIKIQVLLVSASLLSIGFKAPTSYHNPPTVKALILQPGPLQGPVMPKYQSLNQYKRIDTKTLVTLTPVIETMASEFGVCPSLVKAVIAIESGYKKKAKSPKGAIGLMQLMPGTASFLKVNAHDDLDNIRGGIKYLRYLTKLFKGNETLILAAYNSGQGTVLKHGGVPPFKETKEYITKVLIAKALIIQDEELTNALESV
jgi:soluble lytic murein transglycosylase-like protein